jgi:pSer/pThr/pTyr-binding forkhead associated (FHA) protein
MPPGDETNMPDRQWIIGCDRDVDVLVRENVVSRRHCRLSLHSDQYFIEDLASRNGTFLGQQRVVTRTAIPPGTRILLAGSVLMPWPDENLATERLRIGRNESNDIRIEDESVSGNHAILFRDANGVWIVRDLGSTNGTRVSDSETLTAAARVTPLDTIHLGNVKETLGSLRHRVPAAVSSSTDDGDDPPTLRDRPHNVRSTTQASTIIIQSTGWLERLTKIYRAKPAWIQTVSLVALTLLVLSIWRLVMVDSSHEQAARQNLTTAEPDQQSEMTDATNVGVTDESKIANNSIEEIVSDTSARPNSLGTSNHAALSMAALNSSVASTIHKSLYWVVIDADGHRRRVGCALAVEPQRLLACASVIEQLRDFETTAQPLCFHFSSGASVAIEATALHPRWSESRRIERQCNEWLQIVSEQGATGPDVLSASSKISAGQDRITRTAHTARMLSRVFDAGCIRSADKLPGYLFQSLPDTSDITGADTVSRFAKFTSQHQPLGLLKRHRLLGVFSRQEDVSFGDRASSAMHEMETLPLFTLPRISTDQPPMYVGKVAGVTPSELVFSGGFILDSDGRLAGMASLPTELDSAQQQHVARWVSDEDATFDWISVEVLAETIGNRQLSWSPL